jgi:hypothetical protein
MDYSFCSVLMKPMALEQVLSDRDSEDEVDDGVANLEDRRVILKYISNSVFLLLHISK